MSKFAHGQIQSRRTAFARIFWSENDGIIRVMTELNAASAIRLILAELNAVITRCNLSHFAHLVTVLYDVRDTAARWENT